MPDIFGRNQSKNKIKGWLHRWGHRAIHSSTAGGNLACSIQRTTRLVNQGAKILSACRAASVSRIHGQPNAWSWRACVTAMIHYVRWTHRLIVHNLWPRLIAQRHMEQVVCTQFEVSCQGHNHFGIEAQSSTLWSNRRSTPMRILIGIEYSQDVLDLQARWFESVIALGPHTW